MRSAPRERGGGETSIGSIEASRWESRAGEESSCRRIDRNVQTEARNRNSSISPHFPNWSYRFKMSLSELNGSMGRNIFLEWIQPKAEEDSQPARGAWLLGAAAKAADQLNASPQKNLGQGVRDVLAAIVGLP